MIGGMQGTDGDPHDSVETSDPLRAARRAERTREAVTMALYISLSLLAVMVALPPDVTPAASSEPAVMLLFTSIGLLVAHQLAFRLSARLAHHGHLAAHHLELLAAQLVGGLAVTAVAVVPVLVFGVTPGVIIAELLLLAFIAVVGYVAARMIPVSRGRALVYVAGVVGLVLVVIWIKLLVH
jgi:hypothetical protein